LPRARWWRIRLLLLGELGVDGRSGADEADPDLAWAGSAVVDISSLDAWAAPSHRSGSVTNAQRAGGALISTVPSNFTGRS
jgi:hypothetical protein